MGVRKRFRDFRNWCPQPPNPLPTKLKHYSAPIAVVLSVTLFLVSFSVFFSSYVFHPSMPQVPLPIVNVISSSTEPPALNWVSTFGTGLSDSASKVIQTSDGGYALIGTLGNGYAPSTAMLVKTDSSGKMLWNQTYDYLYSGIAVVQTSDGGYTIAGNGNGGFMLVKTDSKGNAIWNQTYTVSYQGNKGGDALTMTQTSDGGYIIAGACTPYLLGQGSNNAFVVKTDSSGKMQWSKTYGGSGIDFFRSVVQVSNGEYVLAGCTTSFGAGGFDAWLVELDSSGNQLWSKTYGAGPTSNPTQPQTGTVGDDEANSVVQTSDGGFALAGYTYSFGLVSSKNAWLIKTDASGTIQWNKTYGGQEQSTANSLIETSDGGLAFAGSTLVNTNWGLIDNMWLVKTDSVGNGQWNQTFGGMTTTPDADIANSLIQTSDGSFVLAGSTNPGSTSHGGYYYVVKTMSVSPPPPGVAQSVGNVITVQPAKASTNSWVPKTPMPTARDELGVAVVNGTIFAIGGETSGSYLGTNEQYDPSTNAWTTKQPMPTPRSGFATAVFQNKIYVIGGQINGNTGFSELTSVNEVYDPATNTWAAKSPLPALKCDMCANVVDGKIYLIGGLYQSVPNATLHLSAETEVYDPATDSWIAKASIPNAVFTYASAVVDNKIYVIAGNSGDTTNLTQVYNPETDKWSYGASIPTGVQNAAADSTIGIYATKAIYVFGGFVGFVSPLDLTQIYYPENDSWSTGASLLTARYGLGVAVINDTLFAIGGKTMNAYGPVTDENSQYIPSGYQTIQTSPSPSSTPNPTSSIPEFPSWIILPLILIVTLSATLLIKRGKFKSN